MFLHVVFPMHQALPKHATHTSSGNPHRNVEVNTVINSMLQMRKLADGFLQATELYVKRLCSSSAIFL